LGKLSWLAFTVNLSSLRQVLRQALGVASGNGHFGAVFGLPPLGFGLYYMIHRLWYTIILCYHKNGRDYPVEI